MRGVSAIPEKEGSGVESFSAAPGRVGRMSPTPLLARIRGTAGALLRWGVRRPRRDRFVAYMALDGLMAALSVATVLVLYDLRCRCLAIDWTAMGPILIFAGLAVVIAWATALYRPLLRYRDARLIWRVMRASVPATALPGTIVLAWFGLSENLLLLFPIWFAMFGLFLAWRSAGTILLTRIIAADPVEPTRVVIYGAGEAGAELVEALLHSSAYRVLAFVDDSSELQGRTLRGLPIRSPASLPAMIARHGIEQVILAIPSVGLAQRRAVIQRVSKLDVRVTTLPPLADIMSGRIPITAVRDVLPEELLSREPVAPDLDLVRSELAGKRVLVTGAGGSIGSALCREILRHAPEKLVVLDVSEPALYRLDQELGQFVREIGLAIEIVPVLCSVLSGRALGRAVRDHAIQIMYHAAAYKHVPLVEANTGAGIENNVFGTLNAAHAAVRHRVGKFVLISTDKAVRPTSIMGASKRMAEMVVDALARRHKTTRFALVRFGNVLDSDGSVVPLFRRQIAAGGPVTVTHPEMVRYFMTIPEAAELVIQAGAMSRGEGCDVFHLDMGEPVRVIDLARRLVSLSGLTVREPGSDEGDIEIVITGTRPGEKLYEELLVNGSSQPTSHPRIFRASDVAARWDRLLPNLKVLRQALRGGDAERQRRLIIQCIEGRASSDDGRIWPIGDRAQRMNGHAVRAGAIEPLRPAFGAAQANRRA